MNGNQHPQQPQTAWPPRGQGQKPSGYVRALGYARSLTLQAGIMFAAVTLGELVMPSPFKPSELMGRFHGRIDTADITAKQTAVVEFERRQAEAHAVPPAVTAMEMEAFRVQQQALYDSLNVQGGIANGADFVCMLGSLIPREASGDWKNVGNGLRSGCGVGNNIRQNMVESLKRGGQQGSTLMQRPAPQR